MGVRTKNKLLAIKILLILICILYTVILYFDFFSTEFFSSLSLAKLISIMLCFSLSVLTGKDYLNKGDKYLLQSGLFITMIADFMILFTDYLALGVGIFSIVHILYIMRYERNKSRLLLVRMVFLLLIILGIYLVTNFLIMEINLLFAAALFYAVALIISVIKAIKSYRHKLFPYPNRSFIALGMVLFLLCDINVGIFNIIILTNNSNDIASLLYNISGLLMWFFYLPSQVLLSLSGYDFSSFSKKYRTGELL